MTSSSASVFHGLPKRLLTFLLVGYLALSPLVLRPFYDLFLFRPTHEGPLNLGYINGTRVKNLFLPTSSGQIINAWFLRNKTSPKVVLLSHGNGGNITYNIHTVKALLGLGVSVLIYDYEGFGQSSGNVSLKGLVDDGVAAYDWLSKYEGYKARDIILVGESLGSAVSCQIAKQRAVSGLIIQAAFASLPEIARERLPWLQYYPVWMFPPERLDNVAAMAGKHAPLLVIHGSKDAYIPIHHSQEIFAQAQEPKAMVSLPNSGHGVYTITDKVQYVTALKEFINKLP